MPPKEDYSLKETKPNIDGGIASTSHKLSLAEIQQFLYVKVEGARNLPKNQLTGTCDPYVEVKIGNYKGSTKYIPNTLEPIWNQVFAFKKDSLHDKTLEILVRDKAVLNDEILGRLSVVIAEIPTRLPWDAQLALEWYRLEDKNGLVGRGELKLAMWVGNQADEAFSEALRSDAANVSSESIAYTRSKVYYSPTLWYLRVKVIEAHDLVVPSDRNQKLEVYVKATFGNMVLKTKVSSKKSKDQSWNEELIFVAAEPFYYPLILSVEDDVGDKKGYLGMCEIPLQKIEKRLLPPAPSDKWFNLKPHMMRDELLKEKRFASKLHLHVYLDGVYHVFDEPTQFSSDLTATSPKLKTGAIGVLELGILKAEGLMPMKTKNGLETTDAYCVAKYGPKWTRTSTIVSSLSPKWNEQYKWDVYDPCTVITIGVFDNCSLQGGGGTQDSVIGKVRIRLSTLETDRIYAHAYPLLVTRPDGLKKMGELHLVVRFNCVSMYNLLYTYTQPLLPKTQYISPLSVYQLDNLRQQAVFLTCLKHGRTEPPLNREVVEYLLDAKTRKWSRRRAIANFERVMVCLSGFIAIWKWYDDIRQWKNPWTTVLILLLFSFLVFYPQVILPSIFFHLSIVGMQNYPKRPRHPPHMETKSSHPENISVDDLEEECDTFPSSAPVEVLRKRYDRLRSIAERITATLGDLATQLERVHSVLTWRDPRATLLFVVFCVIAGLVLYIIPFRWFIIFFFIYLTRSPRFRVTLPAILQNILRRMPGKEDSFP